MNECDQRCAELLQKPNKQEAKSWLQDTTWSKRNIGELSHDESLAVVEELHKLGAKEVIAVDLDEDIELSETTDTLVVILPGNLQVRNRLTAWGPGDSVDEVKIGQKYMYLWWD
jgi:hypothetical protein